ncbi:MAG TPA: tRNA pseudouridine(55) synthase TruB [Candidatus Saccharimonadales bacterium]|nr:tRNA pseudouridine(55) synthase TruB [Candidatus Saccharimonadales bacterium]
MQGILLVDKPAGWTSFDVVNYVRRMVATAEGKKPKNVKVGHSGTLDPFATGLLLLLIGKDFTRRASEFSKLDKTYVLTAILGQTSSTGDPEGEITPGSKHQPTEEAIRAKLQLLTGGISQTPPAYSAIKVDGQRAYKLARAGKEVVIEPRQVTIHKFELVDYQYPELKLVADVSSGTYIRTLAEDLGRALGTGAYTKELRRISIGKYSVRDAQEVEKLTIPLAFVE